jgi:hypothetical protein
MDISSRKISLPLLLVLLEIAILLTSSCYYSNYGSFALQQQQNPLLQKMTISLTTTLQRNL